MLVPGEPQGGDAPFDLMVEDLDATHRSGPPRAASMSARSTHGRNHTTSFEATDPDGYRVTFNSSHVIGPV